MTDARKDDEKDIDALSGVETTGHEWDGIKELNNPLPRWWLWTFYGSIAWALVYTVLYPAWPMLSEATSGVFGYSSRATFAAEQEASRQEQGIWLDRIETASLDEIVADEELARFARAGGRSVFKVNCTQCHGTGAEGAPGYPNLNDDEWIWGGSLDAIYATIAHGVRAQTDEETRYNLMPNFGTDGMLDKEQIGTLATYVATLSGLEETAPSPEGAQLFAENCASCHGETGAGMAEVGGPDLTDAIWLYEGSTEGIARQIRQPRHGMMPAWSEKFSDSTLKQLAVYVHSLGGGQ